MRETRWFGMTMVVVAMTIGSTVFAANGRKPIHKLPLVITEPGSYYLTRDLTHTGSSVALEIQASDVTIDFNGHTLDSQSLGFYGVLLDGAYTNLRIHNGTLKGGNIGIFARNDVSDDFAVWIHDMNISGALNQAIYIDGQSLIGSSKVIIDNNVVHSNGDDGIYLHFIWGGRLSDNVITKNTNDSSAAHGIYLRSCRGVQVRGNTITHYSGDGIRSWYSWYVSVEDNLMSYISNWGMDIYQGVEHVFRNNRAYGNGSGGFDIPANEGHVNAGGNYPPPS